MVRKEGMNGIITFIFNLKSVSQSLYLLHGLHTKEEGDVNDQNTGFGSAIRHSALFSKEEKKPNNDDSYTQLKEKCMQEIEGRKKLSEEKKREMFLEVLQFFCLEQGCLHARAEDYLSTGKLHKIDSSYKCKEKCSMCDQSWHTQHKKVSKKALISWFGSDDFTKHVPVSTENGKQSLAGILWNGKEKWIKAIFKVGKSSLQKYNAECLILSLIASKIISWEVKSGKIEWYLNKIVVDEDGLEEKCYKYDEYWDGIPLQ